MIVLVDSSVWSLNLRRNPSSLNSVQQAYSDLLRQLILDDHAQLLGLVRQELLTGIRHVAQFERLKTALRAFPDIAVTHEDYEESAAIANQCRTAGIVAAPTDFLICGVSLRRNWSILTVDRDFDHIAKAIPITLLQP